MTVQQNKLAEQPATRVWRPYLPCPHQAYAQILRTTCGRETRITIHRVNLTRRNTRSWNSGYHHN